MKRIIVSLKVFILFTILTGLLYPLLITFIARVGFPDKADGSFIMRDNKIVGSVLIGQNFNSDAYFSSRPSAVGYDPLPSGGSNLSLTNAKLKDLVMNRRRLFISFNQLDTLTRVPADMLFASASGLDPDISPEAALLQVDRIVKYRKYSPEQRKKVLTLIEQQTEYPQFHLLGQERINVFLLNLNLDRIK